jgi:hypothetical protein
VSGSRDTLIHVYDANNDFRLLETLDEHEAEVTAVRFTYSGRGLVSCGADHSIIFRCAGLCAHVVAGIWLQTLLLAANDALYAATHSALLTNWCLFTVLVATASLLLPATACHAGPGYPTP